MIKSMSMSLLRQLMERKKCLPQISMLPNVTPLSLGLQNHQFNQHAADHKEPIEVIKRKIGFYLDEQPKKNRRFSTEQSKGNF